MSHSSTIDNRCIIAIREEPLINRLVYVSCSPKQGKRNWIDLCRPTTRQYKGQPFVAVKAIAVDMLPHTSYIQLVIVFERSKQVVRNDNSHNSTKGKASITVGKHSCGG